jgi:hypothetical protein
MRLGGDALALVGLVHARVLGRVCLILLLASQLVLLIRSGGLVHVKLII